MSLYGNYVPENIEMTYNKFQELEGKQKALQEEYEVMGGIPSSEELYFSVPQLSGNLLAVLPRTEKERNASPGYRRLSLSAASAGTAGISG